MGLEIDGKKITGYSGGITLEYSDYNETPDYYARAVNLKQPKFTAQITTELEAFSIKQVLPSGNLIVMGIPGDMKSRLMNFFLKYLGKVRIVTVNFKNVNWIGQENATWKGKKQLSMIDRKSVV